MQIFRYVDITFRANGEVRRLGHIDQGAGARAYATVDLAHIIAAAVTENAI